MNNLLSVNPKSKNIDPSYFSSYGGEPYQNSYLRYTYSPSYVMGNLNDHGVSFETLLDAGCASGEVVRDFRKLGIRAYGVENNKDILNSCVVPQYCMKMDIREIGQRVKRYPFDVIYCNAFMYLDPSSILSTIKGMKQHVKKAIYLCNPFKEEASSSFNDPYRKFLATKAWWDKQFIEAGMRPVSSNIYLV